jgi:geranylgeranyl transferase type-2 subunit alpha
MAPNLSNEQRLQYLAKEREYIEEVLEDAQDCKWPYLASIECATLEGKLKGAVTAEDRVKILDWLQKLKSLDPLRRGRWHDMEQQLSSSST